jgi:molybdopterin synthase catalytic subunit
MSGMGEPAIDVRVGEAPIDLPRLLAFVARPSLGGVAVFLGTVRDHHAGRAVLHLEYEAYRPMAEGELRRIAAEATDELGAARVAIEHRLGRLSIGEVSVAIAVAAEHRKEALAACAFVIETLKRTVPIWKREFHEGGVTWVEGPGGAGNAGS